MSIIKSLRAKALTLFVILTVVFGVAIFISKNSQPSVLGVQEAQSKKVKIGCFKLTVCLSTFIAEEKGYFKDHKIDTEYINFESPASASDALINGNIDVVGTISTSLTAILHNKDPNLIKIINGSYVNKSYPADVLVVTKDSNATSLADLKGKTVSIIAGIQTKTIFIYTAKKLGLNPSQVGGNGDIFYQDQPIADQITSLQSGKVDAIFAIEPTGSQAESLGIGKIVGQSPISTTLSYDYWLGAGVISQKFAKENPQTTKNIINAYDRAIDDIQNDPNAQRQYLEKYLSITEPVLSKVALPGFKKSYEIRDQASTDIQRLFDLFQAEGVLKSKVEVKDMIYNP